VSICRDGGISGTKGTTVLRAGRLMGCGQRPPAVAVMRISGGQHEPKLLNYPIFDQTAASSWNYYSASPRFESLCAQQMGLVAWARIEGSASYRNARGLHWASKMAGQPGTYAMGSCYVRAIPVSSRDARQPNFHPGAVPQWRTPRAAADNQARRFDAAIAWRASPMQVLSPGPDLSAR
jgi:hypothetical protein